jgi:putative copper resistance protein D
MQAFADFSDSVLGGAILVALSVALGGLVFALLAVPRHAPGSRAVRARSATLIAAGAAALGCCQIASLGLKVAVLAQYVGPDAYGRFLGTVPCRAGLVRAALAFVLAAAAWPLRRRPDAIGRWAVASLLGALVAVSGGWLVHATGRLEHRIPLMALTVLHQVTAAVWAGGLVHLGAVWRSGTRDGRMRALWPAVVTRFSWLALGSVVGLCAVAIPLAWAYVGSWDGLVGTGYGSLVLTKVALLGAALLLAAGNLAAVRRVRPGGRADALHARVPFLLEAETIIVLVLLFAAASLSSQPPARDTTTERASVAEVARVFEPKWPALRTPSVRTMEQSSSDPYAAVGGERGYEAYSWSNFSHNVAGLALLAMSLLALAASGPRWRWARHWPLGVAVLGVFVFLRSLAVDVVWPFGPASFWETTFNSAEDVQHRLAGLLAVSLGLIEWHARRAEPPRGRLPYVFPALGAVGGLLMLTHSHVAFELKSSYLVQVTHTTMGALAVLVACGRLLELRLPSPVGRVAGIASSVAMLLIALVLVFYREANVDIPSTAAIAAAEPTVTRGVPVRP